MNYTREQIWVGAFVLVAVALLIGTILAVSGTFSAGGVPHHTYFKSAGGLVPGALVRYGGMKAGTVESVRVDPKDSTRIEIDFRVRPDIPVKTDSIAKVTSIGALSDNYVEIGTGTKGSQLAPPGSELKSAESLSIGDILDTIGSLTPAANQVLQNLDQRLVELQVTVSRVNDLLSDRNRGNVGNSLGQLNALLADSRPKVSVSLTNIQDATGKIVPLLDNLKTTMNQANDALAHVDSVVLENRQDIRAIVVELRETMTSASTLVSQLNNTMDLNSDNIDQIAVNIRRATENLDQLTQALKANPSVIIRGNNVKDRKPGEIAQ